ncbi:MAG: hypothetical protein ACJ8D4_11275 [Xanthobacteraceae bacterium]
MMPASGGGNTIATAEMPEMLKDDSVQPGISAQSAVPLHGLAGGGQQSSIASDAAISDISVSELLSLNAAPPATGSKATEIPIRRANMVRAMRMVLRAAKYRKDERGGQVTISRGTRGRPAGQP